MNFQQTLQFGKIGEGYIAGWLRGKGFNVLPVYEKEINEGKGPTLFSVDSALIAPDLLVFKGIGSTECGKTLWIEAKTKNAFTWHRCTQRFVTGIDLRHYHDYLSIASLSPWPVWLLFLQLQGTAKDTPQDMKSPTGLFGNKLDYLSQHENHRHDNWGKGGMVYWAHETLKLIAPLDEVLSSVHVTPVPKWTETRTNTRAQSVPDAVSAR